MMSNLIFLRALFRLVICKLDNIMNFDLLSLLIKIIIYLLKESLVIILILGFIFPESLIVNVIDIFNFIC